MAEYWDRNDVVIAAQLIRDECGSATLSELGYDGLCDAIWDNWEAFQRMSADQRGEFSSAVYKEIFG